LQLGGLRNARGEGDMFELLATLLGWRDRGGRRRAATRQEDGSRRAANPLHLGKSTERPFLLNEIGTLVLSMRNLSNMS